MLQVAAHDIVQRLPCIFVRLTILVRKPLSHKTFGFLVLARGWTGWRFRCHTFILRRPAETRSVLPGATALDIDVQAFDLLIERRERDMERFGGVGLAVVGGFEGFDDFLALEIGDHFE